jgi:DNA-binding NarL/FixJ family response regulator
MLEKAKLSVSNKQIIELMASGYSTRDIAQSVNRVSGTIKNTLKVLYRKLGVTTNKNVKLVLWYLDPQPKESGGQVKFTPTQLRILELTEEMCTIDIAKHLGLTNCAMKRQLVAMRTKTGAENRVMLALWWKEHGHEAKEFTRMCNLRKCGVNVIASSTSVDCQ